MHIETHGHGPPLALIHGWAMHGGLFAPLIERLADRYTLHVVDLPGHGHARDDATALDPAALAAQLVARVPDAAWLGWSLGGQIALRAALDHPERVRGLVMVASSPKFVKAADWPHGVSPSLFGDFGDALRRDFRGTLEGFLALEALGSASAQDELRKLRAQAFERGEPAERALQEGLRLLDAIDLRDELPGLQVPSLWLSGRRDRLVPAAAMPAAAALAPDARSVVIANAGHAPFLGAAAEVAREIDAFASSLSPRPQSRHSRAGGTSAQRAGRPKAGPEGTSEASNPATFAPEESAQPDRSTKSLDSRLRGNDEQKPATRGDRTP